MYILSQHDSSGVVPVVGPGALPSFSDAHNVLTWSHERRLLRRHGLEPGMSIVSLGCGSGSFEQFLAAELRPMHLAARDSDPWAIAEARSRNLPSPIDLSSGGYQSLPWPDSSFDAGLCRHALWSHSPEEQSRIFAELLRVVRPGGILYFLDQVSTPGDGHPDSETIERAFRQLLKLRRLNGWGIEAAPTQVGVLRKNGLSEVRIDLMLVGSQDQESAFADLVTCWRMESVELALAVGWPAEEIRRLDRGLRAFRQAAAHGQATLPVWILSGRKEGDLIG